MTKLRWLALLMVVTILGITAFQLYWLQQNYKREERTFTIKAEMLFRETVMQLQVAKLKIEQNTGDTIDKKGLRIVALSDTAKRFGFRPKGNIVSTINVFREKLHDIDREVKGKEKRQMVISMSTNNTDTGDSLRADSEEMFRVAPPKGHTFQFFYDLDSLQDTLRISEIDSAYTLALKKEKLIVPFQIVESKKTEDSDSPAFNQVTVGLANPVTYKLQLGSLFTFLLSKIAQPIFFSILLLGITILSFLLLYKSLLKQHRLAAIKNEFISNITHELKTPIATVGVAIEALKNFNAIDNPERSKEYLDISQKELQRLSLMVDKVLKLSVFEKQEMDVQHTSVDLPELVEEVVATLGLQLEKNKAVVTIDKAGSLLVTGDRMHLMSVIFNLLDNAIKYCKANPVIHISMQEKEKEVEFVIADNGIGIPAAYKEKIFEKFFRVPHGDTHNAKGYGLGLSYVAQVIEKHNGTIAVQSHEGEGTTFTITLPKNNISK